MIITAIVLSLIAVYLMQDNGVFTQSLLKKISSLILFAMACIVLSFEYGTLRGVFVFIGLVSVLGTILTLLLYRLQNNKQL